MEVQGSWFREGVYRSFGYPEGNIGTISYKGLRQGELQWILYRGS